jgi:hypothetical protein
MNKWIKEAFPLEPAIGLVIGFAAGWGLFGALLGALVGYFVRVIRRQIGLERSRPLAREAEDFLPDLQSARKKEIEEAYQILGVSPEVNDEEVRRVYRTLAASFHPDGMSLLNDHQQKEAGEAFVRIRTAWEQIARSRGIHP